MPHAITLTANQILPPAGTGILVRTDSNYQYENNVKTDRVDGIRADIRALPDLSPVTVKVPGATAPMSNDELKRLNGQAHFVWVEFTNLSGQIYVDRKVNEARISATATSIKVVDAPDDIDLDLG